MKEIILAFKNFFKRLFVLAISPILFFIGTIAMILELPIWLFTGKGIFNEITDAIQDAVINFLENKLNK